MNSTIALFPDISRSTGMDPHDIAATLQQLNMVQRKDEKWVKMNTWELNG